MICPYCQLTIGWIPIAFNLEEGTAHAAMLREAHDLRCPSKKASEGLRADYLLYKKDDTQIVVPIPISANGIPVYAQKGDIVAIDGTFYKIEGILWDLNTNRLAVSGEETQV